MDRVYCTNVLCVNCRHRTYTSRLINMAACLDLLIFSSIHVYILSEMLQIHRQIGQMVVALVSLNLFERWRPYWSRDPLSTCIGSLHACKSQLTQPPSGGQTTHADARSCSKAMWCVARCPRPPEQLASAEFDLLTLGAISLWGRSVTRHFTMTTTCWSENNLLRVYLTRSVVQGLFSLQRCSASSGPIWSYCNLLLFPLQSC